jgi:hypothetical protein
MPRGNPNAPPPNIGPPANLAEQRGLQTEIKHTLKRINDLQDAVVDKNTEVGEIIKRARKSHSSRETFYHRKQRVDSLFNATVSSADIVEFIQALVEKAKAGDLTAIGIILDRLAGKSPASLDITSAGESINQSIELILDVSKGPQMLEGDATRVTDPPKDSGSV